MRPIHCLPEQREGKTKVIRQQYLPFTVLKLLFHKFGCFTECFEGATAPIVHGMRRRV